MNEPSGRELDAVVAREVMGYTTESELYHQARWFPPGADMWEFAPPRYSTDGNAMLDVLERLSDEWIIGIVLIGDGRWLVWIEHGIRDTPRLEASADTLPRAVALAALRAVRGAK